MEETPWRRRFLRDTLTYLAFAGLVLFGGAILVHLIAEIATDGLSLPALTPGWAAVLGAVVGSNVPLAWTAYRRRVERRGEVEAVVCEVRICSDCMLALLRDGIMAPLYRLPYGALARALPKLVGDGVLTLNETGALVTYLAKLEEINRGLDRSGQAHAADRHDQIVVEYERLKIKVREVIEYKQPRWDNGTLDDAAVRVLFRLLPQE